MKGQDTQSGSGSKCCLLLCAFSVNGT